MLEPDRITEIWAKEPGERGIVGSGYLVDSRRVLTAGHVVEHATGRRCEVRPLGRADWQGASVIWCKEGNAGLDAAVLQLDTAVEGLDRAPLGRFATTRPCECWAAGFPCAQKKRLGQREVFDLEHVRGEVRPLTGRKAGSLTVHIHGSVPIREGSGASPWAGISGAALFAGGLLTGVVIVDPAHFRGDRLEAVPLTALIREPGFRAALTGKSSPALDLATVEDRGWVTSTIGNIQTSTSMQLAALNPNCSKLAVWDASSGEVFDLATKRRVCAMQLGARDMLVRSVLGLARYRPHTLKFSVDSRLLAVLTTRGAILWDARNGEPVEELFGEMSADIAFSPDGRSVAMATYPVVIGSQYGTSTIGGGVPIWDLSPRKRGRRFTRDHSQARITINANGVALAFDGEGKVVAVGGPKTGIYELRNGTRIKEFGLSSRYVALSRDGSRLLTVEGAAADSSGRNYRPVLKGQRRLAKLFRHDSRLVTPGDICVWQVATGSRMHTIANRAALHGVAFSPDGSRFAVASGHSVQIFDASSGAVLHEDDPFREPLLYFAFREDGDLVTVAGHDCSAVVTKYDERGI